MLHRTKIRRASIKYGTRVIYRMNRQLKRCLCLSVCGVVCVQHSSDNNHARHLKVSMYVRLRPPPGGGSHWRQREGLREGAMPSIQCAT